MVENEDVASPAQYTLKTCATPEVGDSKSGGLVEFDSFWWTPFVHLYPKRASERSERASALETRSVWGVSFEGMLRWTRSILVFYHFHRKIVRGRLSASGAALLEDGRNPADRCSFPFFNITALEVEADVFSPSSFHECLCLTVCAALKKKEQCRICPCNIKRIQCCN